MNMFSKQASLHNFIPKFFAHQADSQHQADLSPHGANRQGGRGWSDIPGHWWEREKEMEREKERERETETERKR